MDNVVDTTIKLLGLPGTDKVTGFKGVVTTVGFDVYGCVQVLLTPRVRAEDGKLQEGYWFDVKRLRLGSDMDRVMEVPAHMTTAFGSEAGANDLPMPSSMPAP